MAAWDGWHAGPWIGLVWAAFWVVVVIGAVYLLRRRPARGEANRFASEALAERYARGEIDEDEYRKRMSVLRER